MTLLNEEKNSRQWRLNIHKKNAMFQAHTSSHTYTRFAHDSNVLSKCWSVLSVTHQHRLNVCARMCIFDSAIYLFSYGGVNARAYTAYSYGRLNERTNDRRHEENKNVWACSVRTPISVLTGKCQNSFVQSALKLFFSTNFYYFRCNGRYKQCLTR